MQHRYTIAISKQHQFLENVTNDEEYAKFVEANKESKAECILKRKRVKKSKHPAVVAAWTG